MTPIIGMKNVGVPLKFTVKDPSGAIINLTGCTVTMTLVPDSPLYGSKQPNIPLTILNGPSGLVTRVTDGTEFVYGNIFYLIQLTVVYPNGNSLTSNVGKLFCQSTL